jgi:hypothetical protein
MPRDGVNRDFEMSVARTANAGTSSDGRLEVAEAIAIVTHKVTVDVTTVPPTVTPNNLFDLTFNDASVGIDDESLMRAFKAQLERRLSSIAQAIEANVPPNPALEIELVAQFVFASLTAADT